MQITAPVCASPFAYLHQIHNTDLWQCEFLRNSHNRFDALFCDTESETGMAAIHQQGVGIGVISTPWLIIQHCPLAHFGHIYGGVQYQVSLDLAYALLLNLLQQLPAAEKLALEWAQSENDSFRATAYWLLGRLLLTGRSTFFSELDTLPFIWKDTLGQNVILRNCALMCLKQLGRRNTALAESILAEISSFPTDNEVLRKEVHGNLSFEFEYFTK